MVAPRFLVGHAADLHISGDGGVDPETGGDRRRERLRRAWAWACRDAVRRGVSHMAIAGDVFHTPRPEPADEVAFLQGVRILLAGDVRVVIVPGNHDWELATGLQHALAPLFLLGEVSRDRIVVMSSPDVVDVAGLRFVGFPHPHRRAFDARPDVAAAAIADRVAAVGRAMQDLIAEHGRRNPGAILIAHTTVVGARVAAERVMQLGWDVTVDAACLEPYAAALLGHIHRFQLVAPNAAYAGPIDRLSFSDEDTEPGYVLAAHDGVAAAFEHVPYPRATRYLTIDSRANRMTPGSAIEGAHVRLLGPRSDRTAEAMRSLLANGAASVVDATETARRESSAVPTLDTGVSPAAALDLYMAVRPPDDPVTPELARARLAELDA